MAQLPHGKKNLKKVRSLPPPLRMINRACGCGDTRRTVAWMKFPGSTVLEHFQEGGRAWGWCYGPKNFNLPTSIYFKVCGPCRFNVRQWSLLTGGSLFMTRWSIPLACLLLGGLAGSFVAGPVLLGQNAGQKVVSAAPKELTSYRGVVKT